jgi:hypothetical protein
MNRLEEQRSDLVKADEGPRNAQIMHQPRHIDRGKGWLKEPWQDAVAPVAPVGMPGYL